MLRWTPVLDASSYDVARGDVSELAKQAIQMERSELQELMYVVSSLTTRTDNWLEMTGGEAPEVSEAQLHEVKEFDFSLV